MGPLNIIELWEILFQTNLTCCRFTIACHGSHKNGLIVLLWLPQTVQIDFVLQLHDPGFAFVDCIRCKGFRVFACVFRAMHRNVCIKL